MSYEAIVYFASPRTRWARKIQEEDVIMRRSCRWLWHARSLARDLHAFLDPAKCGWVVVKDGQEVEHVEATESEPDLAQKV